MTRQERLKIVREMFNLEINEEFNILYEGKRIRHCPYNFSKSGFKDHDKNDVMNKIGNLITGVYTVEKLPQKPKVGDDVWFVSPLTTKGYDNVINYKTHLKRFLLLTDFLDSRGIKHFRTKEEVIEEVERLGW